MKRDRKTSFARIIARSLEGSVSRLLDRATLASAIGKATNGKSSRLAYWIKDRALARAMYLFPARFWTREDPQSHRIVLEYRSPNGGRSYHWRKREDVDA